MSEPLKMSSCSRLDLLEVISDVETVCLLKSKRGTQFRIWATGILKEYMRKGFALDDERLKNLGGGGKSDRRI